MDEVNFSIALKKMKKNRISRLKEILFELYAFERNKYEISKAVGVTPQAVGPEIDLLEDVDLIMKTRIEKSRGIPAYYYRLNIESLVDSLNLESEEKEVLIKSLERLRPAYQQLKTLENERKISKLGKIYGGIIPTDHKMFVLQLISSLLIIEALIFDIGFSALPNFLKNNQQLYFILENYSNELQMNLEIRDTTMNEFIQENIEIIGQIYQKIWNELMQAIIMASIIKEPSMEIMSKLEESKKEDVKKIVEEFRNYTKTKKPLNDLIKDEGKIKNQCNNDLKTLKNPLLQILEKIHDNKIIANKIETIRSRVDMVSNKVRTSSLGLLSFPSEKEKIENVKIKIAILKALSEESKKLQNQLEELDNSITFEETDGLEAQLQKIFSSTRNLEKLQKLHADPKEFFEKPIEISKVKKEEIDIKINNLVDKMKEEKLIYLSDFISQFHSEYPNIDIDQKNIISGLKRLSKKSFYPYIDSVKFPRKKSERIVRLTSSDSDQHEILTLASNSPNGSITMEKIELEFEWTPLRARVVLDDLVKNHKIFYKKTRAEGEVWYVPGVI